MLIKYNKEDKDKRSDFTKIMYSFSIEIRKIEVCVKNWLTLKQVNNLLMEYTFTEIENKIYLKENKKNNV
jgi:hypothetical protein